VENLSQVELRGEHGTPSHVPGGKPASMKPIFDADAQAEEDPQ
jgi:hypothetical protein